MTSKLDISSTALEKCIDAAKEFLDKLISPAVEEAGLLLRDKVALWKFKNQVNILNKAKSYCENNRISPRVISLKLLCPLLDGAALEEDEVLQDKWAILLANMIDSDQNIQNHVFPYILGQISVNEFQFLERVYSDKKGRVQTLSKELELFKRDKPEIEKALLMSIDDITRQLEEAKGRTEHLWSPEVWEMEKKKRAVENELRTLKHKEFLITYKMNQPQTLPDEGLREFELSNIIRLGLVKHVQETYANPGRLEIPNRSYEESLTVDVEIEVESDSSHILTELGELFLNACSEKV